MNVLSLRLGLGLAVIPVKLRIAFATRTTLGSSYFPFLITPDTSCFLVMGCTNDCENPSVPHTPQPIPAQITTGCIYLIDCRLVYLAYLGYYGLISNDALFTFQELTVFSAFLTPVALQKALIEKLKVDELWPIGTKGFFGGFAGSFAFTSWHFALGDGQNGSRVWMTFRVSSIRRYFTGGKRRHEDLPDYCTAECGSNSSGFGSNGKFRREKPVNVRGVRNAWLQYICREQQEDE
ncbi:hypothetical protein B0H13DRAFT_1886642 [Mycena leptocephala]|nr:hypothetical protein B0H13DRAFT_1886642 [Mycena leptocephala]